MEEYYNQYNDILTIATKAINNGDSIIICGPEYSGKTYLREQLQQILYDHNYNVYYGMSGLYETNRLHGRTYVNEKFWIEETNKQKLSDILNNYKYIETNITYPMLSNN
jgi:hypothetical protein